MSQWDEGHTLAGWTGFAIATVGATGSGLGLCTGSALGLWGGLGVVLIGALTTWALHLAGWGKPPGCRPVDEWGWRVRDLGAREGHPGCLGCRLAGRGRPAGVPARASGDAGRDGTGTGEAVTESAL